MMKPICVEDPMSTLYKIGDVAKLLGITSETIRRYENHGIVKPIKSKRTGYRYYQIWDIRALTRARMYRKMGYSLIEAADLINSKEVSDIILELSKKEGDLEKAVTWYYNVLKHIRWMKLAISDADASIGKYRIEYRPAMYRIDMERVYELSYDQNKQELYRSWSNKSPFVFNSAAFPQDLLVKGKFDVTYGLVINQEYAGLLNIKESNDITLLPPCLCVYTTIQTNSEMVLTYQDFEPMLEYIQSQGMKLCDDVISRVILTKRKGSISYGWHQLWLPVE